MKVTDAVDNIRPWYKEPWPWVAIAIPAAAVIAGAITFYLAVSNPDYLVLEEDRHQELESGLRAQPQSGSKRDSGADTEADPGVDPEADPEARVRDDKGKL
jgi:hypothetical protein